MIAIYSRDRDLADRAVRVVRDYRHPEVAGAWAQLRNRLDEADQVVVIAPQAPPDLFARVEALKSDDPTLPVVLVTDRAARRLRWLKDLVVEEVVWDDEVGPELPSAVRRADAQRHFRELEARIRACRRLTPVLTAALARAVRRRPPFTSVRAMAGEMGCDRRTLWRHWRRAFGDRDDLGPKGFLDWILLLRASAGAPVRTSWRRIARDAGVEVRTLRRAAGRRLGVPLSEAAGDGIEALRERFRREVLEPLLTDAAKRRASSGA